FYPVHLSLSFQTRSTLPSTHTLPLHDALPISGRSPSLPTTSAPTTPIAMPITPPISEISIASARNCFCTSAGPAPTAMRRPISRSEEHTSELQSRENLVCRLLHEKKKKLLARG